MHIDLAVPGGTVVVNRDAGSNHAHDDLQVAIRDAFEAARRQLAEAGCKHDGSGAAEATAIARRKSAAHSAVEALTAG